METPQIFCGNASKKNLSYAPASTKKEEIPQLNKVLKNMETPQKFLGNASKKSGNPSKTGFFEAFPQFL